MTTQETSGNLHNMEVCDFEMGKTPNRCDGLQPHYPAHCPHGQGKDRGTDKGKGDKKKEMEARSTAGGTENHHF